MVMSNPTTLPPEIGEDLVSLVLHVGDRGLSAATDRLFALVKGQPDDVRLHDAILGTLCEVRYAAILTAIDLTLATADHLPAPIEQPEVATHD
jgi:hypothetical protein